MNSLRHLLLVAVLLFAQLAAGVHAVGHAADNEPGALAKLEAIMLAGTTGAARSDLQRPSPASAARPSPEKIASF